MKRTPRVFAVFSLLIPLGCSGGGGSTSPASGLPTTIGSTELAFDSDRSGNYEIYIRKPDGSVRQLTNNAVYDSWWPKISPDRRQVLFYRTAKGIHDTDYTKTSLWRMNADGSGVTQLIVNGGYGWQFQGHGEWSPDGAKLVMFGGGPTSLQIYVTDALGANPVAITSRLGPNIDPSWSPDGNTIAFISTPLGTYNQTDYEVYTIPSVGGIATRITTDGLIDNDPYFAPNGLRLAWLTQTLPPGSPGKALGTWGIRSANPDGSSPGIVIDDGQINSKPNWSVDGSLIRFHRTLYGGSGKFTLAEVQPNGTGLTDLTPGQTWNNEFPDAGR